MFITFIIAAESFTILLNSTGGEDDVEDELVVVVSLFKLITIIIDENSIRANVGESLGILDTLVLLVKLVTITIDKNSTTANVGKLLSILDVFNI